jgi:hydroxymethylglutaryl-CoA reductase (NADPH)
LTIDPSRKAAVLDPITSEHMQRYEQNIENFIGTVKVPVGLAGPLRMNGLYAQGDYYIPLATTEAALVASYHRGSLMISEAGGCTAALLSEGVSRVPGFAFESISEVGIFVKWCLENMPQMKEAAESTTKHGKLKDMKITIEGNHVYLLFEYSTGDASGQNMVTICTEAILNHIVEHSPLKPKHYFIEANLSGDKKASTQSFHTVRGKKVTAEVTLSAELLHKYMHTTPEKMVKLWYMTALGGVLSGTIGIQGHYANGLAALYLACGQDVACVAESAVGVTRFELREDRQLYVSVTLPNLMVGTVGGGTGLPSQNANLQILGLSGAGKAKALAEVCAGLALAGELSINGAISAQHFTRAHKRLARGKA